jgi:hypothetical protein
LKPIFAYPTLFGSVDLEVMAVTVDGRELPYSQISREERTVALHQTGRADWDVAQIQVKAILPVQEVRNGPWPEVVCLATLSENTTNARSTARLTQGRDGDWHGAIELVHDRHANRASLALAVVAEVSDVPGRLIGTSDSDWYIDLKATIPRRQHEIKIEQIDFREGSEEWLHPFADASWIVETAGEIPTVYLNTGAVEGLIEVINGTGGSVIEKLLRDMTVSQIAQDTWTAMFASAISELDVDDDDGQTPIMPSGWRDPVLRMMLPDVLPGRQLTDALFDINDRRTSGSGWSELQTRIHYAAGKRSQVAKKLTNAVRALHQTEKGAS